MKNFNFFQLMFSILKAGHTQRKKLYQQLEI